MSRKRIKVGTAFTIPVGREHIDASDPCDKTRCMFTQAFLAYLIALYGDRNYRMKSTNHGVIFELSGHVLTCVFDTKTAETIYRYDAIFTKTKSAEKARASVKPFKAKLMVESCVKKTVSPPMSEEKKAQLAEYRKLHPYKPPTGGARRNAVRRELSM